MLFILDVRSLIDTRIMNHSQENFTRDDINVTSFPADVGETLFNRPFFDAIDLYVTPIWYVLGVPGNILAFLVWVQRRMRPSSGYFLAALALDECLFLIMQVTFFYHLHGGCCYFSYQLVGLVKPTSLTTWWVLILSLSSGGSGYVPYHPVGVSTFLYHLVGLTEPTFFITLWVLLSRIPFLSANDC